MTRWVRLVVVAALILLFSERIVEGQDINRIAEFFDSVKKQPTVNQHVYALSMTIGDTNHILFSECIRANKEGSAWDTCQPDKTLFQVGEVSKVFSHTIASKILLGKWDQPVNSLLKEKNIPHALPDSIIGNFDSYFGRRASYTNEDGVNWAPVTVEDLFLGTHGFDPMLLGNHDLRASGVQESLKSLVEPRISTVKRIVPTRQVIYRHNFASTFLAYLAELESGVSYPEYLQTHLLTPLGLNTTFYGYLDYINNKKDETLMDNKERDGKKFLDEELWFEKFSPSTGLISSTEDLSKFMRIFINEGKSGMERIIEEESFIVLTSKEFSLHDDAPGVTYGWSEEIYNDRRYLFNFGHSSNHYTLLGLLGDTTIALSASGADTTPQILVSIFHSYIDTFVHPFECVEPYVKDEKLGHCLKKVDQRNLKEIPQTLSTALGCFVSPSYEHTSWFKIEKLFLMERCVSKVGKSLLEISAVIGDFYIALDEKDILRPGIMKNDEFYFLYPYESMYGFITESDGSPRYMFEDQEVFEIVPIRVTVWRTIIAIYILIISSSSLVSLFFIALLVIEFMIVLRESRKKKEDYMDLSLFSSENHLDEYESSSGSEEKAEENSVSSDFNFEIDQAEIEHKKPQRKISMKSRFLLSAAFDIFAQCILLLTVLSLGLHFVILFMNLASFFLYETYPSPNIFLKFALILPIVVAVLNTILFTQFFCVFFCRTFLKTSMNGCLWVLYLGAMVFIVVLYFPLAFYWNLIGF